MLKRFPRLPTVLSTIHGPIPVVVHAGLDFGEFDREGRRIEISSAGPLETRWHTFWHEAIETAVWDSGVHNVLSQNTKEAVCDALASFLLQMQRNGQLKVSLAWEKEVRGA